MKKAGIVTYFNSYSIGACLQAYATKEFFSELGYDVEFVPYTNKHEQASKALFRPADGLKACAKSVLKNVVFRGSSCLKKAFNSEPQFYRSPSGVSSDKNQFANETWDLLVSGSDQIWNPQISGGIDKMHFLGFGDASKRIALSSSAGSYVFSDSELDRIEPLLNAYDLITVREAHLKNQIENRVSSKISVCPDPTLLFDGEWWKRQASKVAFGRREGQTNEGYILTYFMGKGFHEYYPLINKYINELNLPVWNVQFNEWKRKGVDKTISHASPVDFISLISNASLVISDSFHGVAFSVNLNTPFVGINNVRNPVRVRELLVNCGLDHLIEPENCSASLECNFSAANLYLQNERFTIRNMMRNELL